MDLTQFFKSVLDEDKAPVVICALDHTIIYMNPSAIERYSGYGGGSLLGKSLLDCHNKRSGEMINKVLDWFRASAENNRVHTFYNEKENKDVYMIALRGDDKELIGYYEKHEYRDKDSTDFYSIT